MTAIARAESSRLARPNGWWGMAIFVATEATLFGTIIGTYYYLRFNNVHWPPPGVPEPKLTLPLVLTGILVATSVPMQAALSWAMRGRLSAGPAALVVAGVLPGGLLRLQPHLFL